MAAVITVDTPRLQLRTRRDADRELVNPERDPAVVDSFRLRRAADGDASIDAWMSNSPNAAGATFRRPRS